MPEANRAKVQIARNKIPSTWLLITEARYGDLLQYLFCDRSDEGVEVFYADYMLSGATNGAWQKLKSVSMTRAEFNVVADVMRPVFAVAS